jgi:hypothetical protein
MVFIKIMANHNVNHQYPLPSHASLNCNNSEHLHPRYSLNDQQDSTVVTQNNSTMHDHHNQNNSLHSGEIAMPYAPIVELPNGNTAIPQHYLRFEHTLDSIQHIISQIGLLPLTPIFADSANGGCYIQVGIIGKENYDKNSASLPKKIVYGRKWRIEPSTPTSEIIQTAFLAVKKVWEHELREFFLLKEDDSGKTSAVFSCHHDLPLMADNRDLMDGNKTSTLTANAAGAMNKTIPPTTWAKSDLTHAFTHASLKTHAFTITDILVRQHNIIVDVALAPSAKNITTCDGLSRFNEFSATLVLTSFDPSEGLYALMDALIAYSDNIVEEAFSYQDFARFSRQNHPENIAALSIASRPYAKHLQDDTFASTFQQLNYETDSCRVPSIGEGVLAEKNRHIISLVDNLTGHLPNGFAGE